MNLKEKFKKAGAWISDHKWQICAVCAGLGTATMAGMSVYNIMNQSNGNWNGVANPDGFAEFTVDDKKYRLYDSDVALYVKEHLDPKDVKNIDKIVAASLAGFSDMQSALGTGEEFTGWYKRPGDWKW